MANQREVSKYNLQHVQFSGGLADTVQGDQIGGVQYNYTVSEKTSLVEAAVEIQALLQQLQATNPMATLEEQKAFIEIALPHTRRERLLSALDAGSKAVLEEIPYGSVIKAIIEGWQEPG